MFKRMRYTLGKNKFWEYIFFLIFMLFFYGPIFNMFLLSFANKYEYPNIVPQTYGLKWWDYVLSKAQLVQSIGTSLVLAVTVTLISLAVCLPAAYALARFSFKGRSFVRLSFLLTNAFPKMGIYTAMAVIFYKFNLIGTFTGVVLMHIVNTMMFMVWIPSGAFRSVHIQQEESARDVGASPLRAFFMVTLPMAKPSIIVASLYTFLGSMEEAQGTLLIGLPNIHTMPSELYGIIMSFPDTAGAVFAMILLIPSILLIIVFRKYFSAESLSNGLKM
jgi:putative spermidine/putrescine transport system permease protein